MSNILADIAALVESLDEPTKTEKVIASAQASVHLAQLQLERCRVWEELGSDAELKVSAEATLMLLETAIRDVKNVLGREQPAHKPRRK